MESILGELAPPSQPGAKEDLERLWKLGIKTYDDLLALAMDEGNANLRETACWYLARQGDKRALPVLARCLQAKDPALRQEAARCLGILNGDEACAQLVKCLQQEADPEVRMYAAHSLGMIGGPSSFDALRATLRYADEEPRVRAMAAESLAYVRDPRAIADLLKVLDDSSSEIRYWSVFALGQIGDASVIRSLERLGEDEECPEGLGSIADEVAEALKGLRGSGK